MSAAPKFDFKKWLGWLVPFVLLLLTFVARCHNREQIFHHGGVYFIDGDCYSRMTRVKMVTEGHWVIRHHEFENAPDGVTPHTTAPLDWLIVAVKPLVNLVLAVADPRGTSVLRGQGLDVAGAIISPLLAVLTAAWLWWWAGHMRLPFRAATVLLFALSPILVHGFVLGRPDHQSLLILLLAVALGCELRLVHSDDDAHIVRRAWSIAAGSAWGIALWVSLYEPLVLLLAVTAMRLVSDRENFFARGRRSIWGALVAWVAIGILVDGWRMSWPDPALREYFGRWSSTIGELRHVNPARPLLWQWIGLLGLIGPVLLWNAGREDRRAFGVLAAVALLLGFTIWQMRWGYFFALAFAMSLPWQLRALGRPWVAWIVFGVTLVPVGFSWFRTLWPDGATDEAHAWRRESQASLRRIAGKMRGPERAIFLAPWWMSPQVAYWSGQPGVAGTSHQSLGGILDTARYYLAAGGTDVAGILRRRGVKWIVADNASYDPAQPDLLSVVTNSAALLNQPMPEEALGLVLAEHPRQAPAYLREVSPAELGLVRELTKKDPAGSPGIQYYARQIHRLYRVLPDKP